MRGPLRATLNKSFLRLVIIDVHSVTVYAYEFTAKLRLRTQLKP
jgi:hypothetical protein